MHSKKGQGATADMTGGSHAFRDVARSVLQFHTDPESGRVIFTVDKASYSNKQGLSFAFEFEPVDVPTDDGEVTNVTRVKWLGQSDVSVDDCRAQEMPSGDRDARDAKAWLIGYLSECGGSAPQKDIIDAGAEYGFSPQQLRRAKVHDAKKSAVYQGSWNWELLPEYSVKGDKGDKGDYPLEPVIFDPSLSSLDSLTHEKPTCPKCGLPSDEANAEFDYFHPSCWDGVSVR
jgi:putative DNA primase/helicase